MTYNVIRQHWNIILCTYHINSKKKHERLETLMSLLFFQYAKRSVTFAKVCFMWLILAQEGCITIMFFDFLQKSLCSWRLISVFIFVQMLQNPSESFLLESLHLLLIFLGMTLSAHRNNDQWLLILRVWTMI